MKLPTANAVAILLALAAGIWLLWQAMRVDHALKRSANKAHRQSFALAIELFRKENGFYPSATDGLNDLVFKPANASTNWHQFFEKVPLDHWGHPYLYVFPGKHNTNSYDLSSAGPDGSPGTRDDITNW